MYMYMYMYVKILWGSFLRPTKTMRKKMGLRGAYARSQRLLTLVSLVPRSLLLKLVLVFNGHFPRAQLQRGSMHGMRQDGVPVTTIPADLPGALNRD